MQGNKKLDKAEILEMTIEFIQRLQQGGVGGARGGLEVSINQKEWATDLTTWVIQNKILHTGRDLCNWALPTPSTGAVRLLLYNSSLTHHVVAYLVELIGHCVCVCAGPHSLDSFCQALLLHLQTFGSSHSISSATSLLMNQVRERLLT